MEVEENQYIHTLADYIRSNESKLLAKEQHTTSTNSFNPLYITTHSQNQPNFANVFGIGALIGSTVSQKPSSPFDPDGLGEIAPFTLELDPHHLAYLLDKFQSTPLVKKYIDTGVDEAETSVFKVGSANSPNLTKPAQNSAPQGWPFGWPSSVVPQPAKPEFGVEQELLFIYKFLKQVRTLKMAPVGQKRIGGVAYAGESIVSLKIFQNLNALFLYKVFPATITDWSSSITSLACNHSLVKLEEIIDSVNASNSLTRHSTSSTEIETKSEEEVGVLTKLQLLDISNNSLTEISLPSISHFCSIRQLDLSVNSFEYIPISLASIPTLQKLNMSGNKIASLFATVHGDVLFKNLTELNLQKNLLESLTGVERLTSLKIIDLSENKIQDVFEVGRLAILNDIEEISVKNNPLTLLDSHRTNIFTYFKARALVLTLDGKLPSSSEKMAIRSNLTVSSGSPKIFRSTDSETISSPEKVAVKGKRRKPKTEESLVRVHDKNASTDSMQDAAHFPPQEAFETGLKISGTRRHRLAELEDAMSPSDETNLELNDETVASRKGTKVTKAKLESGKRSPNSPALESHTDNAEAMFVKWKDKLDTSTFSATSSSNELSEFPKLQSDSPVIEPEVTPAMRLKIALAKLRERGGDSKKETDSSSISATEQVISPLSSPLQSPKQQAKPVLPNSSTNVSSNIRSVKAKSVGGSSSLGHLTGIGPYRRIYDYGVRPANVESGPLDLGFKKPISPKIGSKSLTNLRPGIPPSTDTVLDHKIVLSPSNSNLKGSNKLSTSSPDVEAGTSEEFTALNFGKHSTGIANKGSSVRQLPPLTISAGPNNMQQRPVFGMANPFLGNQSQQTIPTAPGDIVKPSGPKSVSSGGTSTTGASNKRVPPVILSRPITFSNSYTSRGSSSTGTVGNISTQKSSDSASSGRSTRSVTINYAATIPRSISGHSIPYSHYARSVTGRTVMGSIISGFSVSGLGTNDQMQHLLPRAPSIPFLSMTNSLQLYLKFQIFESDSERILSWIPGSYVAQLPPYMAEEDDGWSKKNASVGTSGNWFMRSFGGKPEKPAGGEKPGQPRMFPVLSAAELLDKVETIERPGFFLLTDRNLYIFSPNFGFPYYSKEARDPYAQFINNAMQNIRYDDPTRFLTLLYTVPFAAIGRMDLGPNRQYIAVHFLREKSLRGARSRVEDYITGADIPKDSLPRHFTPDLNLPSGTVSHANENPHTQNTSSDKKNSLNLSWYTGSHNQTPFVSLVLLTRDKSFTSRLIENLTPVLHTNSPVEAAQPVQHLKRIDGRQEIINQDVEWAIKSLRENILLKKGEKNIIYNKISSKWKGRNAELEVNTKSSDANNFSDGIKTGLDWIGGLLAKSSSTTPVVDGKDAGITPVPAINLDSSANNHNKSSEPETVQPLIAENDWDHAFDASVDSNAATFMRLYLLVGLVLPHSTNTDYSTSSQAYPPPTVGVPGVKSCSLIATNEYLYLTTERFDVWPPLLFPPEFEPTAHVNDNIEMVGSRSQPGWSSNSTAFKGLVADLVTPFSSPPLTVGRVADICRCERWRSWRYTSRKEVQQIGAEADDIGIMIMNGAVGACGSLGFRRKSVSVQSDDSGNSTPTEGLSRMNSGRRGSIWRGVFGNKGNTDAGNAAGWGWWIRVVFKKPMELSDEENEYWWDIVFSTMDSANEFLEYIRDVRGVRPEMEEDDVTERNPVVIDDTEGDADKSESRDEKLFDKRRKDGVVLVIGDD